jgi:hypothetical protein
MCSGSSGCSVRVSIAMKQPSITALSASATIVTGSDHELVSAFEKP